MWRGGQKGMISRSLGSFHLEAREGVHDAPPKKFPADFAAQEMPPLHRLQFAFFRFSPLERPKGQGGGGIRKGERSTLCFYAS